MKQLSCLALLCCFVPVPCPLALLSLLSSFSVSGRPPALLATRTWLSPFPQSLLQRQALGLVITGAPAACPLPLGAMSRIDALRRLSARLAALAELEESIAQDVSSVLSGTNAAGSAVSTAASPVSSAAQSPSSTPLCEAVAPALVRPAVAPTAPRGARSRSRSPAPLPKRAPRRSHSVASMRGSVALDRAGLVTGLTGKSCPPVPPTLLRASRVARALQASSDSARASGPPPAAASQATQPTVTCLAPVAAPDSDSEWDALLDAHGLTPPPGVHPAAGAQSDSATGAGRRARDKRRRRVRRAAKRSMWRDI